MRKIIVILTILLSVPILSNGQFRWLHLTPYFKHLKNSEYIVKARVVSQYQLIDTLMIMAVVEESFNSNPNLFCINDTIALYAISGMECRPLLNSFDTSSEYYFSFYENIGKYCFSFCFSLYFSDYGFKKVTNNKIRAQFSRVDIILNRLLFFTYYSRNMKIEKFEKKLIRKRSR